MTGDRWSRLRTLFDRVREMPQAARTAFLDRELAGEPDLRRELETLLAAGAEAVGFLAEQVRPIRRRVALKLVKAGMDTRQVLARFRTEQQALALMDHPGIARPPAGRAAPLHGGFP